MTDAVIVAAHRTAIGTAIKGTLADTSAFDLADAVVGASLKSTGLPPDVVDDVVLGEALTRTSSTCRAAAAASATPSRPPAPGCWSR